MWLARPSSPLRSPCARVRLPPAVLTAVLAVVTEGSVGLAPLAPCAVVRLPLAVFTAPCAVVTDRWALWIWGTSAWNWDFSGPRWVA